MGILAWALGNIGICGAVALAVWVDKSPWPLLGLVFLLSWKSNSCDMCQHCRRKKKEDDDGDDE